MDCFFDVVISYRWSLEIVLMLIDNSINENEV